MSFVAIALLLAAPGPPTADAIIEQLERVHPASPRWRSRRTGVALRGSRRRPGAAAAPPPRSRGPSFSEGVVAGRSRWEATWGPPGSATSPGPPTDGSRCSRRRRRRDRAISPCWIAARAPSVAWRPSRERLGRCRPRRRPFHRVPPHRAHARAEAGPTAAKPTETGGYVRGAGGRAAPGRRRRHHGQGGERLAHLRTCTSTSSTGPPTARGGWRGLAASRGRRLVRVAAVRDRQGDRRGKEPVRADYTDRLPAHLSRRPDDRFHRRSHERRGAGGRRRLRDPGRGRGGPQHHAGPAGHSELPRLAAVLAGAADGGVLRRR